jgi:hypothetical protein
MSHGIALMGVEALEETGEGGNLNFFPGHNLHRAGSSPTVIAVDSPAVTEVVVSVRMNLPSTFRADLDVELNTSSH